LRLRGKGNNWEERIAREIGKNMTSEDPIIMEFLPHEAP